MYLISDSDFFVLKITAYAVCDLVLGNSLLKKVFRAFEYFLSIWCGSRYIESSSSALKSSIFLGRPSLPFEEISTTTGLDE